MKIVFALLLISGVATADEWSAPPPAKVASPAPGTESRWLALSLGAEAGGPPLLHDPGGPVAASTATEVLSVFARIQVPVLSSRIFELSLVPSRGYGLMLESADLHVGGAKLRLLDLGLFYSAKQPITVARVARTWDLAIGAGLELPIMRHVALVADVRLFAPLDLWDVVTHYGDTARLIGDEILHGTQVWGGAAFRW